MKIDYEEHMEDKLNEEIKSAKILEFPTYIITKEKVHDFVVNKFFKHSKPIDIYDSRN